MLTGCQTRPSSQFLHFLGYSLLVCLLNILCYLFDKPVGIASSIFHQLEAGRTAYTGMLKVSPASVDTAGPWKSITKKERTKGLISINYGISRPSNDMWPWSPSFTVYCVLPNTIRSFDNSFNGYSSSLWRVRRPSGGALPRRMPCGASVCSSIWVFHMVSLCIKY
jgi:hypothetical protein